MTYLFDLDKEKQILIETDDCWMAEAQIVTKNGEAGDRYVFSTEMSCKVGVDAEHQIIIYEEDGWTKLTAFNLIGTAFVFSYSYAFENQEQFFTAMSAARGELREYLQLELGGQNED